MTKQYSLLHTDREEGTVQSPTHRQRGGNDNIERYGSLEEENKERRGLEEEDKGRRERERRRLGKAGEREREEEEKEEEGGLTTRGKCL